MSVHLPPHRLMSLREADEAFGLEAIWESTTWEDGDDTLTERYSEDDRVIVFDGDTAIDNIYPHERTHDAFGALVDSGYIVIIRGNLQADTIHMFGIKMLFVFGDLTCNKINFYAFRMAWVQGNFVAHKAALATSDQDDTPNPQAVGREAIRVQGTATSPALRSWWMRLSHLNWTAGSGAEFCEEDELPFEEQLSDPIWKL